MSRLAPIWVAATGRRSVVLTVFLLTTLLAACQASAAGPTSPSASRTGAPASTARSAVHVIVGNCNPFDHPCPLSGGTYRLAPLTVLPGLEMTVPSGWSGTELGWTAHESDQGELALQPPGQSNLTLAFWLDMVAIKSTGPRHGTILKNIGRTPSALVSWLTSNPDFLVVSKPAPATIGHGITMTSLVIGVSRSANYGDRGCPANPRCADLFTNSFWAKNGNGGYGIGGNEEVRLYLSRIKISGRAHTFLIALDANNQAGLLRLERAATPILGSLRLPAGASSIGTASSSS